MPCYQVQTFTNQLITSGDSKIDNKSLELGLINTGLKMQPTSIAGQVAIQDKVTGKTLAYLQGNTISIYGGTEESRERDTDRIRQAYSVGVVIKQASSQYLLSRYRDKLLI